MESKENVIREPVEMGVAVAPPSHISTRDGAASL